MIEILNTQTKHRVNSRSLRRLAERLARRYRVRPASEISLAFVTDASIRRLNRMYRRKDKVTDVLSFPVGMKAPDGKRYLGDIVIAPGRAAKQAKEHGHGLERELGILLIHGFLHLIGYDHRAWRIEKEERRARREFLDGERERRGERGERGGSGVAREKGGKARPAAKARARRPDQKRKRVTTKKRRGTR